MSGNVLEYVIKLTDMASVVASKLADSVKRMADRVSQSMSEFKEDMDVGPVEEKLIKTKEVLEKFENAFALLVPNGKALSRVMDDLEHDLDGFNRGFIDQKELFKDVASMMEDYGASEKQISRGMDVLKSKLVEVANDANTASETGVKGFNALRMVSAALHGNFGMLASQLARFIPAFKNMGAAGTVAFAAVGAAVMSTIKLFGALKDLVKVAFNLGRAPKDIRDIGNSLDSMVNSSRRFYENMDEARKNSNELAKRYEETAKAINEATKAQNEFNRAQELALAQTDAQRAEINARYDLLNSKSDEETTANIIESQRKELEEEDKRLRAELQRSLDDQGEYLAKMKKLNKTANESKTGVFGSYWADIKSVFTGHSEGNDKARAASSAARNAGIAYDEALEKEAEIRKKLEENEHKRKLLDMKKETEETKAAAKEQKEYTDGLRKIEQAEEKAAAKEQRDDKKAIREAEKEAHKLRMAEIKAERKEVKEAADEERDAIARLKAARADAAQAWGWYKDRAALAKHDAEVDKNVDAGDQYEKDYHSLTHGVNSSRYAHLKYLSDHKGDGAVEKQLAEWRRKKTISVDTEATMRVALANRNEFDAENYAKQTAEATVAARDYLESISETLNGGGEE